MCSNMITTCNYAKDRASARRGSIAKGALSAAKWLITQKPGFYGMREFLKEA